MKDENTQQITTEKAQAVHARKAGQRGILRQLGCVWSIDRQIALRKRDKSGIGWLDGHGGATDKRSRTA